MIVERDEDGRTPGERGLLAQLAMQRALGGEPRAETVRLALRAWDEGELLRGETCEATGW